LVLFANYYKNYKVKEGEMGRASSKHKRGVYTGFE
jgi:hypothetical protein